MTRRSDSMNAPAPDAPSDSGIRARTSIEIGLRLSSPSDLKNPIAARAPAQASIASARLADTTTTLAARQS
ncbi:MAG: hypothetical protein AMXMBFR72_29180 [Betaproteobacteria bacterium]|nr:MAG: hypothetical protein BroJett031_08510 [Betaproteobacteria bacterium]